MLLSLIAVIVVWVMSPYVFGTEHPRARRAVDQLGSAAPQRPSDDELNALTDSLVRRDRWIVSVVTCVFVLALLVSVLAGEQLIGFASAGDLTALFVILIAYGGITAWWARRTLAGDSASAPRVARPAAAQVADCVDGWERRTPAIMTIVCALMGIATVVVGVAVGTGVAHVLLVVIPPVVLVGVTALVSVFAARRTVSAPQRAPSAFGLYGQDLVRSTAVRAPHWIWMFVACGCVALTGVALGFTVPDHGIGGGIVIAAVTATLVLAIAYISAVASSDAGNRFKKRLWTTEAA